MTRLTALDHTVINVHYQMDQAQQAFAGLGFQLTERGFHTLGSINHLMMFRTDYLELIGLPAEQEGRSPGRAGIVDAPMGINGLVFKSADVDAVYAHLQQIGMAAEPPGSFSRPVDLPEGRFDASFRTVHLKPGVFPGGRVYFCEHHTPELVWRAPWSKHPNQTGSVREFVVVAEQASQQADQFGVLLDVPVNDTAEGYVIPLEGSRITVLDQAQYKRRYADLSLEMQGRKSIFGAIVLRTVNIQSVRAAVAAQSAPECWCESADSSLVLREPQFATLLEWVQE